MRLILFNQKSFFKNSTKNKNRTCIFAGEKVMEKNENVEMITGDPKKAINKLSLPIIASMFLIFINNIIDSIWVAGLGTEPLAALGYIT